MKFHALSVFFALFVISTALADSSGLDSLENLYNSARKSNPKSCRTSYYGLFTNGREPLARYEGDGVNYLEADWRKAFEERLKASPRTDERFLDEVLEKQKWFTDGKQKMTDALNGLLPIYRTIFKKLFPSYASRFGLIRISNIKDLGKMVDGGGAFFDQMNLNIQWGPWRAIGIASRAAHAFWQGHELTHGTEPNYSNLNECLIRTHALRDGGEVTKNQQTRAGEFKEAFDYFHEQINQFGSSPSLVPAYESGGVEAYVEKWAKTYMGLLPKRIEEFRKEKDYPEEFLPRPLNPDRIEAIKRNLGKALEEKLKYFEKNFEERVRTDVVEAAKLEARCLPTEGEISLLHFEKGMDFGSGRGTEWVATFGACVTSGHIDEARKLLAILQKYPGLLPDQLDEARADWVSAHSLVEFIKETYPREQWKNAALAVWFSLPPHRFSPRDGGANIMNTVGSKKTNEERALHQLGANRDFTDLVECEPEPNLPYCL